MGFARGMFALGPPRRGTRIDPARRMMLTKLGGGKVRGLIKAIIKVLIIAGHNDI